MPFEVSLDEKVKITSDMKEAIQNADVILLVVSTSAIRPVCKQLKEAGIKDNQILVNTSKGLELPSLKRMSEVIKMSFQIKNLQYYLDRLLQKRY